MHSPSEMTTLRPGSVVVNAQASVFIVWPTWYGSTRSTHFTPMPRSVLATFILGEVSPRMFLPVAGFSCWPVIDVQPFSNRTITASSLLYTALATLVVRPLCQNVPSPMKATVFCLVMRDMAPVVANPVPMPVMVSFMLNGG